MLVGDSTSGTFSATVGLYGGYRRSPDATGDQLAQTGPSRLITQPAATVVPSLATETWTGTDGAAWPAQWTSVPGNTIQANRGRMTAAGGFAAQAAFLSGMTAATDSDTVITLLPPTTGEWYTTVAARASAITTASNAGFPSNGIAAQIGSNSAAGTTPNFIQVHRCSGGTNTQVNFTGISLTADAAGYKMRLNVQGSTYRVRVWGASSSEPTAWAVTYVDATPFLTPGKTWLGVQSGAAASAVTVDADDLTVTDAAPTSATAAGTITLDGTATAQAPTAAAGSITLAGTATARATASATGSLTLSGTGAARVSATATGSVTLGGTATARAAVIAAGSISLAGLSAAAARAAAQGLVALAGLATPQVGEYVTHTYVTVALLGNGGTALLAGDGTGTAELATSAPGMAALAVNPPGLAALDGDGQSTAALAGNGTSSAALQNNSGAVTLQTTT